jgi:hypothetical protein
VRKHGLAQEFGQFRVMDRVKVVEKLADGSEGRLLSRHAPLGLAHAAGPPRLARDGRADEIVGVEEGSDERRQQVIDTVH